MTRRRAPSAVGILATVLLLTSCFSWAEGRTFGVAFKTTWWGAPTATVTISRRPTLRLRQLYRGVMTFPNGAPVPCDQRSDMTRVRCVQRELRTAGDQIPTAFTLRSRWMRALDDDQLGDLNTAVNDSAPAGRCLTLHARLGFGGVHYNWTHRDDGHDGCVRGLDPTPDLLPPIW